jgi:hypothetical protein
MRIVRILGGLGNQMFQYAFARCLQKHYDEDVYIDSSAFNGYPLHDGYLIKSIFGEQIPQASKSNILKLNYPLFHYRIWQIGKRILPSLKSVYKEKKDMVFDAQVFDVGNSTYYDGYWQSEQYYSECQGEIRDLFKFPPLDERNKDLYENHLKNKETASIHVRRGDYLKEPLFRGLTDLEYYKNAIERLKSSRKIDTFVIFSNDIEWCKLNIVPLLSDSKFIIVDWNIGKNSYRDMQLMSLCTHNVVANSSFSWWGAWLNSNEDKIVISPKRWINKPYETDIIPQSWIRM